MSDQQPKLAGPARRKAERIANLPAFSPEAERILVIAQKVDAYGFSPELAVEVFKAVVTAKVADPKAQLALKIGEGDELSESELTIARWIKDDNQGIADVNKIALQFNLSGGAIIDLLKRWYWMDLLTEVEKPKENGRRLTEKMLILL